MACLESLIDDVAEILEILKLPPNCCDDTDVSGGDQYTDRVVDGVDDVPQNIIDSGYADDAADWDGFDDYKCMISHVIVDQLYARLMELAPYATSASLVVGGLATVAAIVTTLFTGGLTAIAFGLIASTGAVALLYQGLISGDLLEILAAKVTTNHDDLACAVYGTDGDVSALAALNDMIDELFTVGEAIILKNMNLGPTLKALYSGRYDQQDMAEILFDAGYDVSDFDCSCSPGVGYYWYYNDSEAQDWKGIESNSFVFDGAYGIDNYCMRVILDGTEHLVMSDSSIREEFGLTATAGKEQTLHQVRFWYKFTGANGGNARLYVNHDGGQSTWSYGHPYVWTEVVQTFDPPLVSTLPHAQFVKINTTSQPGVFCVDQIVIDLDMDDD